MCRAGAKYFHRGRRRTTSITGDSIGFTQGVAVDSSGNIYVASGNGHVVRKITPGGIHSTFAGTGVGGFNGVSGTATSIQLNAPSDVWVTSNGDVYICDQSNRLIRKVDTSGNLTTVAGVQGSTAVTGNGIGFTQGVAVDSDGNIYVAAGNSHVIRKITPGGIHSTFAGTGVGGFNGVSGTATSIQLNAPSDVWVTSNGDVYICDQSNRLIRKVDTSGNLTTVAGVQGSTAVTGNGIGFTQGVAVDSDGNIYVAAGNSHVIRKITPDGVHSTIIGNGTGAFSGDGGAAAAAQVNAPCDLWITGGNALYIADQVNRRIRFVPGPPRVISVSASTTNGAYNAGDVIAITVNFSGSVNVSGTPQLTLETGTTDRAASYALGSGSATLTFSYTVQAGDTAVDLDYASTTALALNGGTIIDATSGQAAGLTLPAPGAANSLGANKALVIDTTAPTIFINAPSVSLTKSGPVIYAIAYSDTNFNASTLSAGNITVNATGSASAGSVVISGSGSARTVTLSSITGNGTLGISIAAGTASDTAGNQAPAAGPSNTFTVDNTPPTISIGAPSVSLTKSGPVSYVVTYSGQSSASPSVLDIDFHNTGDVVANSYQVSGSGNTRTVTFEDITGNGSLVFSIAAGTAVDAAGNSAPASSQSAAVTVDNTPANHQHQRAFDERHEHGASCLYRDVCGSEF